MTSVNLDSLAIGSVSKYSPTGGAGFNIQILGDTIQLLTIGSAHTLRRGSGKSEEVGPSGPLGCDQSCLMSQALAPSPTAW